MRTCRRLPLLIAFAAFMSAPAPADDWTEFRGPGAQGHAAGRNLPARLSETENVVWKTPVAGRAWSSPVVADGRIYLTTAVPGDDEDYSLRVLCLDVENGSELWSEEVFHQSGGEKIHQKNSHASPTPIVDGGHVFVHFGTHGTACLTTEGEVVWRNSSLAYRPQHGNGGSPVLVDDLLVVNCDGADVQFIVALDRADGRIRWKTPRHVGSQKKFSFCTPLVIEVEGRRQIVSPGTDSVSALDPRDGRVIWTVDYAGFSVVPRPVYAHGLVYICTGFGRTTLLAIRPDGRGSVTDTHVAWQTTRAVPKTPSLLIVGEELYMVSDEGIATCLDARTGAQRWQQRLGGKFSASPLFADGKIWLQSEEGETIVIAPGREYVELSRSGLKARTLASLAISGSTVFLRTDAHLYRFEQR